MDYASVSFRVSVEEKEALRNLANEKGITLSKLCSGIVLKHCLEYENNKNILGQVDLELIAEVVRAEFNQINQKV